MRSAETFVCSRAPRFFARTPFEPELEHAANLQALTGGARLVNRRPDFLSRE